MAVRRFPLLDDASLVRAVQDGDRDAYSELYGRHFADVKRLCARRLGSTAEAEEVAQAAFVRAFERIGQCGGEARFGSWVQVIAHRLCIDNRRSGARTRPEREPVDSQQRAGGRDGPEETLLRHELVDKLNVALAALPDRQREVMIARHFDGKGPAEIAASFGMSLGSVDSLLLRARRRMATMIHELADGL